MLAFAAAMLLAATNPIEFIESNLPTEQESTDMELVFEENLENALQEDESDEIVFDDSLLNDSELLELEE